MGGASEEGAAERELGSLTKLARKNFAKFAVAIQHASSEVQLKIIEQLPEFRKLAMDAVDSIGRAYDSTISSNQQSEDQVHAGYREWRAALIEMLDQPDLSLEDKLRITAQIGETVKGQSQKDTENKAFKAALFGKIVMGVVGVVGVLAVAVTGGKLMLDQGDSSDA